MKKYNKSEIMKRAWRIKKEENKTFSSALKKSWNISKMMNIVNQIENNQEFNYDLKIWMKNGMVRVYANNGTSCNKKHKFFFFANEKGVSYDFTNRISRNSRREVEMLLNVA